MSSAAGAHNGKSAVCQHNRLKPLTTCEWLGCAEHSYAHALFNSGLTNAGSQALEASYHWASWALTQGVVSLQDLLDTREATMPAAQQHMHEATKSLLECIAPLDDDGDQQWSSKLLRLAANETYQLVVRLLILMEQVRPDMVM